MASALNIELQIVKVGQLRHYLHKGIVGRFAAFTAGDHVGCDTEPEYTIKHQHNVSA
jgi:hypothetical protein